MEPSGVDLSTRFPTSGRGRRSTFSLGAVLAAVLVACSPAATPSVPPDATGTSPAATASAQPTAQARAIFHISGDAPVIPRTIVPDRGAVLPGAVTIDGDGVYHAWVIAFGEPIGTQEIHHLTSSDAMTWTVQLDDSLAGLSEGLGNPGAIPSSVVQAGDPWAMYLVGTLSSQRQGFDIWRATAPTLDGPWTRSEEPVLTRGEAGAWDAGALDFPTVIPLEAGYDLFYSAIPSTDSDTGAVGRATSEDGIEWTKDEGPVLEPGVCGGFDERAIHQPRVLVSANGYVMAYAGLPTDIALPAQVGFADSVDGSTWACEWPDPALDTSTLSGEGIHTINAFHLGDNPALLVEWLADDGTDVWLAEFGLGG